MLSFKYFSNQMKLKIIFFYTLLSIYWIWLNLILMMMIFYDNSNLKIGKMRQILARQWCWKRVWKLKNKIGKRKSICVLCSKEFQSLSQEGRVQSKLFISVLKFYIVVNCQIVFIINCFALYHFLFTINHYECQNT